VGEGKGKVGIFSTITTQRSSESGIVANTKESGGKRKRESQQGQIQSNRRSSSYMESAWEDFPTFPPVCGGDDGLPNKLDGLTFSKWRRESIKAYGNAIVPQVAMQIFKAIEGYAKYTEA